MFSAKDAGALLEEKTAQENARKWILARIHIDFTCEGQHLLVRLPDEDLWHMPMEEVSVRGDYRIIALTMVTDFLGSQPGLEQLKLWKYDGRSGGVRDCIYQYNLSGDEHESIQLPEQGARWVDYATWCKELGKSASDNPLE